MAHIGLLIFIIISLGFLVAHSYFTKGRRITITFFLFAFIAAAEKELNSFLGHEFPVVQHPSPFFFPSGNNLSVIRLFMVITGWVFVFYLSWYTSEKVLGKVKSLSNRIFPVVLFAGIVAGCISYAIETTGTSIGWWKWVFKDNRLSMFLVGKAHFFAVQAWFYFNTHFLAAYFLIECSRYKRSSWKAVFFLVYLIRIYLILFFFSFIPREIEEYVAFSLLILLAFFSPLAFDLSGIAYPRIHPANLNILDKIPLVIIMAMSSVLFFLDIFILRQPVLLFSLAPLFSCVILTLPTIRLPIFLILSIILLVIGKAKMMPLAVPVFLLAIFYLLSQLPYFIRPSKR